MICFRKTCQYKDMKKENFVKSFNNVCESVKKNSKNHQRIQSMKFQVNDNLSNPNNLQLNASSADEQVVLS